jgi:D-alanyl-D-alanine carboxypeptidase
MNDTVKDTGIPSDAEHAVESLHSDLESIPESEDVANATPVQHVVGTNFSLHTIDTVDDDAPRYSTIPTSPQLAIALSLMGGLFAISYMPWFKASNLTPGVGAVQNALEERLREPEAVVAEPHIATSSTETSRVSTTTKAQAKLFEPNIRASSAFVWDVRRQRALYKKNASSELPLASLTKLMTSLVALETLGAKAEVPMTLSAIQQDGPSDFEDGEVFTSLPLSDFALLSSSNDAAYALALASGKKISGIASSTESETAFVAAMNTRAKELGLTQTHFMNPTGLDQSDIESGSYGTARDVAFLMEYLVSRRPDIITGSTQVLGKVVGRTTHSAHNTNELVNRIPALLGTKTGYTELAGGNLVVAFDAGFDRPIIVSVLGSSREGRFQDVDALITYAQQVLADTPTHTKASSEPTQMRLKENKTTATSVNVSPDVRGVPSTTDSSRNKKTTVAEEPF